MVPRGPTPSSRKPRRNIDPDVRIAVEAFMGLGINATAIHTALERSGDFGDRLPTSRTIRNLVSDIRDETTDGSEEWSLVREDGESEFILGVLREVYLMSKGKRGYITIAEAEMLKRIGRVAPEMPRYQAFFLARSYLIRHARGEPTGDLDAFLAFRPFTSDEAAIDEYLAGVKRGWFEDFYRPMVQQWLRASALEWGDGDDGKA